MCETTAEAVVYMVQLWWLIYIDACVIMKATQNVYDTNKYTSFDVQPDMRLTGEPMAVLRSCTEVSDNRENGS